MYVSHMTDDVHDITSGYEASNFSSSHLAGEGQIAECFGIVRNLLHPTLIRLVFHPVSVKKFACQSRTYKLTVISLSIALLLTSVVSIFFTIIFSLFYNFLDPFRDAAKGVDETSRQDQPIHIRIQQRSGRKTLTTVQGINEAYDLKKLVKAFKKVRIFVKICLFQEFYRL